MLRTSGLRKADKSPTNFPVTSCVRHSLYDGTASGACTVGGVLTQAGNSLYRYEKHMHKKIGNLSIKCTCVCSQSCLTLCNPMDCSPPDSSVSVEFSRQEYWNGLPSPTPEDFPDPGIRPMSPLLVGDSLPLCLCVYTYIGKAHIHEKYVCK